MILMPKSNALRVAPRKKQKKSDKAETYDELVVRQTATEKEIADLEKRIQDKQEQGQFRSR